MSIFLPPLTSPVRRIGARTFDFSTRVAVMAVVNRTPDSFFDQGRTFALEHAVDAAVAAAEAGADWVDIGGVPFSPDTPDVSAAEEIERVCPVIEALAARSDVVISVDTFRAEVAARAIEAGASVINDTTGIHDHDLARVVAGSRATLVITHSLARPRTHYPRPQYADVAAEITTFLTDRVRLAQRLGVPEDRIVIDPGHDLNKNTLHTLELTRRFSEIAALGLPTLAAVSNKDFVGETLGREKHERLAGSIAAATIAITQGARIIRMHDVPSAVDTVRMVEAVLGFRKPAYLQHNMS